MPGTGGYTVLPNSWMPCFPNKLGTMLSESGGVALPERWVPFCPNGAPYRSYPGKQFRNCYCQA